MGSKRRKDPSANLWVCVEKCQKSVKSTNRVPFVARQMQRGVIRGGGGNENRSMHKTKFVKPHSCFTRFDYNGTVPVAQNEVVNERLDDLIIGTCTEVGVNAAKAWVIFSDGTKTRIYFTRL